MADGNDYNGKIIEGFSANNRRVGGRASPSRPSKPRKIPVVVLDPVK